MQNAYATLRVSLWDKLKPIFNRYSNKTTGEIQTSKVQEIVMDVLGETTQEEINYVIKNMFRLDSDGSGTVSFLEFGNFLFKRHCGQMSLQKAHRQGLMKYGAERKMLPEQFWKLVNQSFDFLKVQMPRQLANDAIRTADKDGDGMITYVEYFQFIDSYICFRAVDFEGYAKVSCPPKLKKPEPQPVKVGRQWNSRLRLYLWLQLKKLYELYVCGRTISVSDEHLRALLISILGQLSEIQMTFILNGLFNLRGRTLQFSSFYNLFMYLIAELGLSRYQANHYSAKKILTAEQFVVLLRNTFKFLSIYRVREQILLLIFAKINQRRDGCITYEEYLRWVKLYLAVDINRGDEYYLVEDDDSVGKIEFLDKQKVIDVLPDPPMQRRSTKIQFHFSSYELSKRVRQRVWDLLIPFDSNHDLSFDQLQIKQALSTLLKENQYQIPYMTRNVFRYDKDGDKTVTYEQLTNFCVEQHFGEMAIQRLHKVNSYSRGKQRIMNQAEFAMTLNNALSYVGMKATEQEIKTLFREIDLEKRGWISYEIYFFFLKYYFGSLRGEVYEVKRKPVQIQDPDKEWIASLSSLSPIDRFIRILHDQLRGIFLRYDYNKNLLFEEDEIQAILHHVFNLNQTQVSYIISHFFKFQKGKEKSLNFDELIAILLEIYFIEIILKKKYKDLSASQWKNKRINLEEFISLINYACFFLRKKPLRDDLINIFNILDTDKDGWITFNQYIDFIRKYLGLGIQPIPEPPKVQEINNSQKPHHISTEQWEFIHLIWGELKMYFDRYDTGAKGFLNEENLRKFVIEILHENSQRQLDYVFWNLFRVDPNKDCAIEFHQFAPFILNHAGEIALQRFHKEQVRGKSNLSQNQLGVVFSNAFCFLSSISKSQRAIRAIYHRIGNGGDPTYGSYLSWINRALARKFA